MTEGQKKGAATAVLAVKLYRELSSTPGNLFFSPYSIATALAMLQAGASGATRRELETVLGLPDSGDALVDAHGELANLLQSRSRPAPRPFVLSVASSIWCQRGYSVHPGFIAALQERLSAEVREADFENAREEAARSVNEWVRKATRDRIPTIVEGSQIDRLTRALLANAIYFKSEWLHPFEEEATRPEPFHLLDGSRVEVPMMHQTGHFRYARRGNVQAVELPYGNDWVVMLLLLPDEGKFERAERELHETRLAELISRDEYALVNLSLPRFRAESSYALRSPLESIGLSTTFRQDADFSGISLEPGFAVGEVLHKAVVDVDECGTEAAAATAVILLGIPLRPPKPLEFRVDRPFLFTIWDRPTGTVLFKGRVVDPSR